LGRINHRPALLVDVILRTANNNLPTDTNRLIDKNNEKNKFRVCIQTKKMATMRLPFLF
jgi:hypothetical protein